MAALLEVKGLKAFYGQTQSLYDVGFDIPKCRCGGVYRAFPDLPVYPRIAPTRTR